MSVPPLPIDPGPAQPRSFGQWLRDLVGAPPAYVPPPPPPLPAPPLVAVTQQIEPDEPILVPAERDAFDFYIHPVYIWSGVGLPVQQLRQYAHQFEGWARRTVRDEAIGISRQHAPHQGRALEWALNERFDSQNWPRSYRIDGLVLKFRPRVRVVLDQRIREYLRPYWQERIRMECDHELGLLRTRLVAELTREWCEVLRRLGQEPTAAHASRLTDERFAKVFREFVEEQRQVVPDIVDLLRYAVGKHDDLGLGPSEYTQAWDVALRTYQKQHGLTIGAQPDR
ncbi:hypothetical protein GCM10027280_20230 [Micromonospora polyrhachis]|uniref:Uncharacterized protein n=1 Tax=Micromonospora polyrhachis TaxID=1282883 RepID=A0A7W7WS52_9ACTN|nr:hypothetical protein [Micromonospora polyrhachis]MBB4961760.1 hypothetical protein [Micromonospora polyrhachis]